MSCIDVTVDNILDGYVRELDGWRVDDPCIVPWDDAGTIRWISDLLVATDGRHRACTRRLEGGVWMAQHVDLDRLEPAGAVQSAMFGPEAEQEPML